MSGQESTRSLKGQLGHNGKIGGAGVKCLVCKHADIDEINMELAAGASVPYVSVTYSLPIQPLYRHRQHHLIAPTEQGFAVIDMRSVMDIPLNMKERQELIKAIVERLLEPLGKKGKYAGVHYVEWNALAQMLRLQQRDEITLLKIAGVMNDEGSKVEAVNTPSYQALKEVIEVRLQEIADSGGVGSEDARIVLSEKLLPIEELLTLPGAAQVDPTSYRDLGAVAEYDDSAWDDEEG